MFEAGKVAGSAKYKVQQYELLLSFKFSLFIRLT